MPMPWTYRHADKEFRAFLDDARERMGLDSDNMTYTAVDGVFRTFRRRLTPAQGLAFADLLPAILRAIFVQGWDSDAPPLPFANRAQMTREVQALRPHHNLTPDNAIEATAWALRRSLRQADLDRLLAGFPPGAAAFWHVDVADPSELEQRII
ncbi:DUF2267 domain-containing protein [Actibacterium ureilyticum]|uniref:DUF2267 domain-containing protein n=1 Tax=Actibacterium ureilyticum TaxID=1590614 RepID=UPI000BAACB43|nr:DUF2267 domain-containing protein [Actibacterium ureilyticum]